MKKADKRRVAAVWLTVLWTFAAGTTVCSAASSALGGETQLPGKADRATPGDAAWEDIAVSDDRFLEKDEKEEPVTASPSDAWGSHSLALPPDAWNGENLASPFDALPSFQDGGEEVYSFCTYDFAIPGWLTMSPLKLGDIVDVEAELPSEIDVYLDGPEGHLDEPISLPVVWDLSSLDFYREGVYLITGSTDTHSCEYPVNWDQVPRPSFSIEIAAEGVLSFQIETHEDTLVLHYLMNGKPFRIPSLTMELYETQDDGQNWRNIVRSSRIKRFPDRTEISGIVSDSMFQMTEMNLGGFYSPCSDIVRVNAGNGGLAVRLTVSDGLTPGGNEWNEDNGSFWDSTPVSDLPYPVLKYGYLTSNPQTQHSPLQEQLPVGHPEMLKRERYHTIYAYYGDALGTWEDAVKLPAEWDWSALDDMDWNQEGITVVHGSFSEDIINANSNRLDFDTMPELTLTILLYEPKELFHLYYRGNILYEGHRAEFIFAGAQDEPMVFDDLSGVTVWCSADGGESWYDITGSSNVELRRDGLSVSHMNREQLRRLGYTFQLQQTSFPGNEAFSSSVTVTHDSWGVSFSEGTSGERGGGKRYEKPPEGLFDTDDSEGGADVPDIDQPDTDQPDTDQPGTDQPGADQPGNDQTGNDQPGNDQSGNDQPGNDQPGNNQTGAESPESPSISPPSGGNQSSGPGTDGGHLESINGTAGSQANQAPALKESLPETHLKPAPEAMPAAVQEHHTSSSSGSSSFHTAPEQSSLSTDAAEEPASSPPPSSAAGSSNSASGFEDPRPASTPPGTAPAKTPLRAIAGATAVLTGAGAGFWMIRRR